MSTLGRLIPLSVAVATTLFASTATAAGCAALYGQCGGIGYSGTTCCITGSSCQFVNDWYSQCRPYLGNANCNAIYGQCGGNNWNGPTCCQSDWTCRFNSEWYSQCLLPDDVSSPEPTLTASPSPAPSPCATNWGQCGGINWNGPTCCQNNWHCVRGNDYYYQCLSTAPPSPPEPTTTSESSPEETTSAGGAVETTTAESPEESTTPVTTAEETFEPTTAQGTETTAETTPAEGTASSSAEDITSSETTFMTVTTSAAETIETTTETSTTSTSSTPTPSGRVRFGGVNIAGFDFGSYDNCGTKTSGPYITPSNLIAQINHFVQDDALNAFRLPVSWQYLINQFDGGFLGPNVLDSGNFDTYDSLVQGCLNAGAALCIIDVHNYARFNGRIIGQDGPSAQQFASLWSQIATRYAGESRIAFGLMNEPHDEGCSSPNGGVIDINTWAGVLQTAVNAIRAAGANSQMIILPGKGWTHAATYLSGASSDGSGPALMGITDPAGGTDKLVFEVHEYLDSNNSGGGGDCVTNNIDTSFGRGGFSNLVAYLRAQGRLAMLTETGGPATENCARLLCQQFNYLAENSDVFLGYTNWAAGAFDPGYSLSNTPTQNGNTWTDSFLVQRCVVPCLHGEC